MQTALALDISKAKRSNIPDLCSLVLGCQLCFLVIHQVADVRLNPHKVGHMALAVMNGCDGQIVDERIAILLVVQQLNNAWLACRADMMTKKAAQDKESSTVLQMSLRGTKSKYRMVQQTQSLSLSQSINHQQRCSGTTFLCNTIIVLLGHLASPADCYAHQQLVSWLYVLMGLPANQIGHIG